jgi:DNA-directed RNA polymerase subunit RPC12/RpoP
VYHGEARRAKGGKFPMSRKPKAYEWGNCAECGEPMKLKPADRLYCKPACRYRHSYKSRPKLDLPSAFNLVREGSVTVRQAVAIAGKSETTIRRLVKAGTLTAEIVAGRVLVFRSQVEKLRRSA